MEIEDLKELKLKDFNHRKKEEELQLKEEEIILRNLEEQKIIEAGIIEEKRIKDEDERIKKWERKFDEDQIRKEEELIKKFNDQLNKEKEENKKIIEFKKEVKIKEIIEDEVKKEENEGF